MRKAKPKAPEPETPESLAAEIRILHQELTFLRKHKMFKIYQSVPRALFYRMLTGMAVGLGTVIGATFLLSIIVWALSQIEFLPIIGEWSAEIARTIEDTLSNGE